MYARYDNCGLNNYLDLNVNARADANTDEPIDGQTDGQKNWMLVSRVEQV